MHGSIERVTAVVTGGMPDRAPLYDLLRNDAVLAHFAGMPLTPDRAEEAVYRAYAPAIDATRPRIRVPEPEETVTLPDGREERRFRWTSWTAHREYADTAAYLAEKRRELDADDPAAWGDAEQAALDAFLRGIDDTRARLGEVFYFPEVPGTNLQGLYSDVGLATFTYALAEDPGLVAALLERNVVRAETRAAHLPEDHGIVAVFLGDDIAFGSGPIFNPAWMRANYFPLLTRAVAAWRRRGIRVLFHSDGNLNPILDDLVAAGIDGLNPLEVLAGMDIADVHRRHPHLFLAGGIDVSQLLPFGSPRDVKDAVARAIDAAEGRLLAGSSTELNDDVPLENFLAMRDAVLEHPYG
jgi:uroporphyrinogen decarboxylase